MTSIKRPYTTLALSFLLSCLLLVPVALAGSPSVPQVNATKTSKVVPRKKIPQGNVMAKVNGEMITRNDLAQECLRHYGERVLEGVINRRLLEYACQKHDIKISAKEISAEIERMAKQFDIPLDQWYEKIISERGISPEEYRKMIWMLLAQKKLAGTQMEVTKEELVKAYETQYGPAVKARLIAVDNPRTAQEVRAKAIANPDSFENLAKQYSIDPVSASSKGWIPPIRRHSTVKTVEDAAFSLKDGQISQVIPFTELKQYIILKREGLIPALKGVTFEQAEPKLREFLEHRKLGKAGHTIAKQLQNEAHVKNYIKNPPKKDTGIAAVINGKTITTNELAEECMERFGEEALEGAISRRLLEQACKKAKITITEQDIKDEITRAAYTSLPPKKDGSPDIEKWMTLATEEQGVSRDVYVNDSVWPSVALKKLIGNAVVVTEKDIQKGYEANYGPKAKCLVIVLDDFRRATHVWELAQKNPSPKNFGDLAEQYSIDPASRKLRGEIPPIQKHTGNPILEKIEKEAFALKEGELSSIIHVVENGDKYIIILGMGKTQPINVDPKEAKKLIYEDIYQKKQRIEMSKYFMMLQQMASIDNYITGESRAPAQGPSNQASPSLRPVEIR